MAVTRLGLGAGIAFALTGLGTQASATLIFDNYDFFSSTGVYIGQHDFQIGDRMVLPSPSAGSVWRVDSFTGRAGASVAGSYTDLLATISIYRTVNVTGTGPAFSDLLGSATRNVGSFTSSGPGVGKDFTAGSLGIVLNSPPTNVSAGYGILVSLTATGPGTVHPHLRDQDSTVPGSSSSQGWYRDLNDDFALTADEYEIFAPWPNGNLMFELNATAVPVPEPASATVFLLTSGLFLRRRKRRS